MKANRRSVCCLITTIVMLFLYSCDKQGTNNNPIIYAYFEADDQIISGGETVNFTDMSLGTPTEWEWSFEGGTPSTSADQNPSVVYDEPGKYKVSLTVSDGAETSVKEVEDFISVVSADYLKENLVAYYPFDGSAEDAGPESIAAENEGNVTFDGTDKDSNENGAAVFDGESALILPDHPTLNFGTDNFSVSLWIKTDQTDKMMVWQESGAEGSGDNQAWLRIGDNTTDRLVRFATEDGGGGNILNYGDGPESGVSDSNWHHVVCVREAGTTRLYLDGVKVGELARSSVKDVSNSQDFKIGAQEGPVGSYKTYFTGLLDELRIYNKALTDQEVSDLYNL